MSRAVELGNHQLMERGMHNIAAFFDTYKVDPERAMKSFSAGEPTRDDNSIGSPNLYMFLTCISAFLIIPVYGFFFFVDPCAPETYMFAEHENITITGNFSRTGHVCDMRGMFHSVGTFILVPMAALVISCCYRMFKRMYSCLRSHQWIDDDKAFVLRNKMALLYDKVTHEHLPHVYGMNEFITVLRSSSFMY